MKQKKLVLFGASGASVKVADMLDSIQVSYDYFVDNDAKKWGTTLKGKKVHSPQKLLESDCNIIIASTYQNEIEEQLKKMGIYEKLIWKEQLMLDFINQKDDDLEPYKKNPNYKIKSLSNKPSVIMDLEYGLGLGGTESWVFDVSEKLLERGHKVQIFTKKSNHQPPEYLKNYVNEFAETYEDYWNTVKEMIAAIANYLPCTIIINAYNQIMFSAVIAKKLFGEKVKLVLMTHNDNLYVYRRVQLLLPYFDIVSGVSKKIITCLEKDFFVEKKKLYYKENAVDYENNFKKTYTLNSQNPLIIGFAGRIQKEQKRCDLIEQLTSYLDKTHCNYQLKVAGNGSFFEHLKTYAKNSKKIELLGYVPREEMPVFWKSCDIYLSLSDYEGASLSMLEAMSYGVIPIVTEVSGVSEFVKNNINGFSCKKGDVKGMADRIKYIELNRNCLQGFGKNARNIIKEKCNREDYITYIESLL